MSAVPVMSESESREWLAAVEAEEAAWRPPQPPVRRPAQKNQLARQTMYRNQPRTLLWVSRIGWHPDDMESVMEISGRDELTIELWALALQNRPEHAVSWTKGALEPATNRHLIGSGLQPPERLRARVEKRVAELNQEDLEATLTTALDEHFDYLFQHVGDPVWFMDNMLQITRQWAAKQIELDRRARAER